MKYLLLLCAFSGSDRLKKGKPHKNGAFNANLNPRIEAPN
jgi:hypothetical protein